MDMRILYALESLRTPFLDKVFGEISYLGEETVFMVIAIVVYWCINKRTALKLAFIFFFSGLAAQGLKVTFRIERPWIIDPAFKPVESAIGAATGYSFPSGHTQAATALYGTLAILLKKWWQKLICAVILLAVMFSRLYLGVHTLLDVLVAFGVTMLIAAIFIPLFDRFYEKPFFGLPITLIMVVLSIGVMAYAVILMNNNVITYANARDCCKTAGAGVAFAFGYYIERRYVNFDVRAKNVGWQILKFVCGVAPALGAYAGLKALFSAVMVTTAQQIFGDFTRYFILVFWIMAGFPAIIKAVQKRGGFGAVKDV